MDDDCSHKNAVYAFAQYVYETGDYNATDVQYCPDCDCFLLPEEDEWTPHRS